MEENAHLRATVTNTTERVLLKGDASIFLSNEYVGTTKVKMAAPNEQFQIFLGIDDAIKIKRELIERAVDKGNLCRMTYDVAPMPILSLYIIMPPHPGKS